MKKRIFIMLLLLSLAVGLYVSANAKGEGVKVGPTQTAQASQTATEAAQTCTLTTGINKGTVNLRACPGAACGAVLDILTEGESLTIITAGEYVNVTNTDGVTGWLNKKYCKGKNNP